MGGPSVHGDEQKEQRDIGSARLHEREKLPEQRDYSTGYWRAWSVRVIVVSMTDVTCVVSHAW